MGAAENMNQYQRLGTFIVRLVGVVVTMLGVLGEVYAGAVGTGVLKAVPSRPPSVLSSSLWLIAGVLLMSTSRPLGRYLGKGLD